MFKIILPIVLLCFSHASSQTVTDTAATYEPCVIPIKTLEALGKVCESDQTLRQPDFTAKPQFGKINWANAAHQLDDYRYMSESLYRTQDAMGRELIQEPITDQMMDRLVYKDFPK